MTISFRPSTPADTRAVYRVFTEALADLSARVNQPADSTAGDADAWLRRKPLFDHLAATAAYYWLAEDAGEVIGYARSIQRGPLLELTELFVLPGRQSAGVGGELLRRAFPADAPGVTERAIIATIDTRAQARYLRAGVYPRFPIYEFNRAPEPVSVPTDLEIASLAHAADPLAVTGAIDTAILGHRRDPDHAWLQATRQGYAYFRAGRPVGYGYLGRFMGPFAVLDSVDLPAALAHAETEWHALGNDRLTFEVPLINQAAVDYLLARRYQLGGFFAFCMTNVPFGRFDRYVCTSPLFFI